MQDKIVVQFKYNNNYSKKPVENTIINTMLHRKRWTVTKRTNYPCVTFEMTNINNSYNYSLQLILA